MDSLDRKTVLDEVPGTALKHIQFLSLLSFFLFLFLAKKFRYCTLKKLINN